MVQTTVNNLIINKMTKAQYTDPSFSPNSNELYFITDDTGVTAEDIIGNGAIGSSTQPIYWDGDSFEPIASYEGNSNSATRANLTTTANAIAKYSNTTGTFANSGVTIDSSNNISTAGSATVQHLYIFGNQTSNKTNRFFTSNALNNIYASVGGVTSLVITDTEVRKGGSSSINLGTQTYPWNNIYGNNIYGNGSNLTSLNASNLSSGTVSFDRLPSIYWANITAANAANYNTTPEVASVKIGNGTTATSTKNVVLQYDSTNEVLNFVFT